jgi:hypothetical protein
MNLRTKIIVVRSSNKNKPYFVLNSYSKKLVVKIKIGNLGDIAN